MQRASFARGTARQTPPAFVPRREAVDCRLLAVLVVVVCMAPSCARQHSTRFLEARAAAERDYSSGRYEQAARAWRAAGDAADYEDDRIEALYRSAAAYERAEQHDAASDAYLQLLRIAPNSSRAPRAAYDLALLELDHGATARGELRLRELITRYQDSALASRAFALVLRRIEDRHDKTAALAWVESVMPRVEAGELLEQISYSRAGLLLALGQQERAREAYLSVAEHFPYPKGAYWDDALWHVADIERAQGKPEQAIGHLEQMLLEVEPAHFQGSYARSRYAEAQFRIAEIYRDDLRQPTVAREQFRKVYREHPTSLMRDDALWQEAITASRSGDPKGACDPLEILVKELPDSRYAPCAQLLCDRLASAAGNSHRGNSDCHPYIKRTLEENHDGTTESKEPGSPAPSNQIQSSK